MTSQRKPAKFVGALAAIVAAVEGAILILRKTVQAAPPTVVSLAKEVMDLLVAMAQGIGAILEKMDELIEAIRSGGGAGQGYPPNTDSFTTTFVPCAVVQPNAYQLPYIEVPDGFSIELLARNPLGPNAGIIWVSWTQSNAGDVNRTQSRPLAANGTMNLNVKNANSIYIGATIAGEGVYITVEQRRL